MSDISDILSKISFQLPQEGTLLLIIQPFALLLFVAIVWSIQSFFVTTLARRYIYPHLYYTKITEWFIAKVSVIIHEGSHLVSAVFTGSAVDLKQSYVTPMGGRITAIRSETIGGWISNSIAATAPSFFPPLIFAIIFILISQQPIVTDSLFSYPPTFQELMNSFERNAEHVLLPLLVALLNLFDLSHPITFLFLYVLIVCSITAGPSEGDWRSTLELFFSPIPAIVMLAAFFLLNLLFANLNIGFLIPFTLLVIYLFIIVILGVFFAFLLSTLLALARSSIKKMLSICAIFGASYTLFFFLQLLPVACFFLSLFLATICYSVLKRVK